MTGTKLEKLLGVSRRDPDTPVREVDMDMAASIQQVTEEIVLRMGHFVHQQTGCRHLCMAGGVALNCVANGRLDREGPFDQIWIQPAAGDAGGALGVAWLIWHQLLEHGRQTPELPDAQQGSQLGSTLQSSDIDRLHQAGAVSERLDDDALFHRVAGLIASGKVVGWAQGRMEFGPRALGNRSILGDARNTEMQTTMNVKIKFRESFRPFAPIVMEEYAPDVFEMPSGKQSPYMLFTYDVCEQNRIPIDESIPKGIERVRQPRSDLPAITHLDYSARVQTVGRDRHPRLHQLLREFHAQTGCPVMINTSFNVRGEPIVRTAEDAFRCFMATNMDALAIDNHLFLRESQPASLKAASEEYLTELEPD